MKELGKAAVESLGVASACVLAGVVLVLAVASLAGCDVLGTNPSAPNKLEGALFSTVTNTVTVTNLVQQPVPVYVTNQVVVVTTNQVAGAAPVMTLVTNPVTVIDHFLTNTVVVVSNMPAYKETVSGATQAAVQTAGSALNMFLPGIGGLVSSGVLGLLSLWGYLRSSKLGDTSAALAQEIETVRTFVRQLPNGQAYDGAFVQFMQAHQAEAGVTAQVLQLLEKEVSNSDAQTAAKEVATTIQQLQLSAAPQVATAGPFGAKVG